MKKVSTLIYLYILFVFVIAGCNNADTEIKEVNLQGLNNNIKTFVDKIKNSNGLYLYSPVGDKQYLIVNYSNVLQGEEAKFLDSIKAQILDQTLIINIEELGTHDYTDKRLENIRIFNLGKVREYEKIQIFKNGKETAFDIVGG